MEIMEWLVLLVHCKVREVLPIYGEWINHGEKKAKKLQNFLETLSQKGKEFVKPSFLLGLKVFPIIDLW